MPVRSLASTPIGSRSSPGFRFHLGNMSFAIPALGFWQNQRGAPSASSRSLLARSPIYRGAQRYEGRGITGEQARTFSDSSASRRATSARREGLVTTHRLRGASGRPRPPTSAALKPYARGGSGDGPSAVRFFRFPWPADDQHYSVGACANRHPHGRLNAEGRLGPGATQRAMVPRKPPRLARGGARSARRRKRASRYQWGAAGTARP